MIRANASVGTISAKIEASTKRSEGSQKRKRRISRLVSSKGTCAADRSGTDDYAERGHPRPWTGSVESEIAAASRSASPSAPHGVTSSEPMGFTDLTQASDDQSLPLIDVAQVRAFIISPV